MLNIAEQLREMRSKAFVDQRAEQARIDHANQQDRQRMVADREVMVGQLRVAQPWEYAVWLKGYMEAGGLPTRFYDYDQPRFWTPIVSVLAIRPLYGSLAFNGIIIPEGFRDDGNVTGHTSLYIIRNGQFISRGFHNQPAPVPVYRDTELEATA